MAESKNGVYYDIKANEVVESPPEEGVQIVAPGAEITLALQEDIDRYKDAASGKVSEPDTVTTKTVTPKKG